MSDNWENAEQRNDNVKKKNAPKIYFFREVTQQLGTAEANRLTSEGAVGAFPRQRQPTDRVLDLQQGTGQSPVLLHALSILLQ